MRNILVFLDYHMKMILKSFYYMLRALIFYKRTKVPQYGKDRECVVLGNGPSLSDVLDKNQELFSGRDVFCVNEFALTDYYQDIKPIHYVLADPNYWNKNISKRTQERKLQLFSCIESNTDWKMTLYVPYRAKHVMESKFNNPNISVCYINSNPIDGYKIVRNFTYKFNIGMPPALNVLIAAIFCAINTKYKNVYILGADHSWHEEIMVGKDNVLYVKQKHFYKEDLTLTPIYKGNSGDVFRIHEVFLGWSNVFYSYVLLDSYAKSVGCKIYNLTKKSYIDSFERLVPDDNKEVI